MQPERGEKRRRSEREENELERGGERGSLNNDYDEKDPGPFQRHIPPIDFFSNQASSKVLITSLYLI